MIIEIALGIILGGIGLVILYGILYYIAFKDDYR